MNITLAIKRLYRYWMRRCLVCGKKTRGLKTAGRLYYCSVECACYDGTYSVVRGWRRKPSILKTHNEYGMGNSTKIDKQL